jgi:hypothetical protein
MSPRFGQLVTVEATVTPYIGQAFLSVPLYYPARRPTTTRMARPHADDGAPEGWPGKPLEGSDSPRPEKFGSAHLRLRRTPLAAPLTAVVVGRRRISEGSFTIHLHEKVPQPFGRAKSDPSSWRLTPTRRITVLQLAPSTTGAPRPTVFALADDVIRVVQERAA